MKLTKECKKDIKRMSKEAVSPFGVLNDLFATKLDDKISGIFNQFYSLESEEDGEFLKAIIDYAQKQINKREKRNGHYRDN